MMIPDYPVYKQNQDKYERYNTACNSACRILSYLKNHKYENSPSIVYGIQGDWGEGKTSFLNFIKNELKENTIISSAAESDSVRYQFFESFLKERIDELKSPTFYEIVDFNPWSCFSYNQLVNQFFIQIKEVLTKYDGFDRIESDLAYYASVLVSAGGELPRVGWLFSLFDKLFCLEKNKSLVKIKKEISNFLVDKKINLVIVIDDSDRLLPDNLMVFLQFITTIVDYPNTVFLLAYCRKYFIKILTKSLRDKKMASDFLEKIIDVPFDLPSIPPVILREELEKSLMNFYKDLPTPLAPSITEASFLDSFSGIFTNFRQLKRFLNKLETRRWQFEKGLDPQDVTALAILQCLFPDDCKIIFADQSTFLKYLSYSSADKTEDPWLIIDNREKIISIFFHVFPSWRTYGNRGKRLSDISYFDYYFLSEDYKSIDEIESFLILCSKEGSSEQVQNFFTQKVKDVFDFREHIKNFFSARSDNKQNQAFSCYKTLIEHFDFFDPVDASDGVYEQNIASLVKFDYAMDFLGCVEKEKRVELIQEIFEKEKLEIALYFFQNIFLNSAFDSAYGKRLENSTELMIDKDDKQKILDAFIARLKKKRSDLLNDDDIWFTAHFLQLIDAEEISIEAVQDKQNIPIKRCTQIINDLFSQWNGRVIDEGFYKMIKPFIPKAKSNKYYFIRAGQYEKYSRIFNQENPNKKIKENLIELGQHFKKDIERYVRSSNMTSDIKNHEQSRRYVCIVLFSEMNGEERESVVFTGISLNSIEERIKQYKKEVDSYDKKQD